MNVLDFLIQTLNVGSIYFDQVSIRIRQTPNDRIKYNWSICIWRSTKRQTNRRTYKQMEISETDSQKIRLTDSYKMCLDRWTNKQTNRKQTFRREKQRDKQTGRTRRPFTNRQMIDYLKTLINTCVDVRQFSM